MGMRNRNKAILATVIAIGAIGVFIAGYRVDTSVTVDSTEYKVRIVATFYPLYEFTKAVAGDKAHVDLFIPSGVEPHDWEPTPRDIERLRDYDLLIYQSANFEPYIESIRSNIEVSEGFIMLESAGNLIKGNDPHTWLDPLLAKEQVINIMNTLISIDGSNEGYYRSNAESYLKRLDDLHAKFVEGLSECKVREFITMHAAYTYLADRYNLRMITISGIEPEHDVAPSKIREVIDAARIHGLDVVYTEEGLDDRLVNALADEIGARVLTLSPVEVVDEGSYIEKMEENLASLREGVGCR